MNEDDITKFLDPGMFPATKDEIILMAEDNDASYEVMDALVAMPNEVYDSIHEVWEIIRARRTEIL